jgi:hypothetical protein
MIRTGILSMVFSLFVTGCAQATTVGKSVKPLTVRILGRHVEKPSNVAISRGAR